MVKAPVTFTCIYCYHTGQANDFMPTKEGFGLECVFQDACARRQKRDKVLAEITAKSLRTRVHPVDRFTRLSIALCGIFMGAVIAIGVSYLWLGI